LRRTFLNASGDFVAGCEHNDILSLPEYRVEVLKDLVRSVRAFKPDELGLVGFKARAAREIRDCWPAGGCEGYSSEGPYVSLERLRDSGGSYLDALSSNTRAKIRRSIRGYSKKFGEASLDVARSGDEALEWFHAMVKLHEDRWQSRGLPGAFASREAMDFHTKLIAGSTDNCSDSGAPSVDIVRLRFGSESIAFLYNLRHRGAVSFYQAGFRYHDDNRLRPGLVAHAKAVEHYLDSGELEYDFLAGEPDPVQYKRSLSTDIRTLQWIELPSPTLRMAAIGWLRRSRRRARALLLSG
jgi:CelD/BcsL family acetyltransferase involved in cellulose biosynthesis